jgi:hypothetical protein
VTPQLRTDHHVQVSQNSIVELDFERGIAVQQLAQRGCPSMQMMAACQPSLSSVASV